MSNKFKVKIKLASPADIKEWAHGKVTESETLNYRTLKPVNGGLFCAQIFGPINDYECLCRRYKGYKYDGIVCERCNVQVTSSAVRRERMGYIQLPVPVIHPWYFRNNNKLAILLDIPLKELKKITNLERYIVFEPGDSSFKKGDLITTFEYESNLFLSDFVAETGAAAIKKLLEAVDLDQKIQKAKELLEKKPLELVKKKYRTMLELCEGMKESDVRPEWMILDTIAVIPPDLRPLLEIEGGKFVSSDINELYRTVIYRVKRLESLIKNQIIIPLILHNEIRMLQDGINSLFGYRAESDQKDSNKKYKSLEDRIKGKEGSLRKSMLGKREDFSGRSVIVIEPTLLLDECYLPKEMALEILRPAVIGSLRLYGFATSIKQAKRLIENKKPEVWDILNEIVNNTFPIILLNRAPTLHRIGIMAFKIKLWDKQCIGVNPLVCPAFNADFDGDQMAVHLPLSEEAKAEAWMLMRPTANLGSATHGNLIVGAFRDIALGIYTLSLSSDVERAVTVSSIENVELLLLERKIGLNDLINFFIEDEKNKKCIVKTTAGRMFIWEIVKQYQGISFDKINGELTAKNVHDLMKEVRINCGDDALSKFSDEIKTLGFKYGNKYTGSIGKDDFFEIPNADKIIEEAIQKQIQFNVLFEDGLMTQNEMRKKSDDLWKKVALQGKELLEQIIKENRFNPLVTITKSGARGSINQMLQILFMKGNVTDMTGNFSVIPIWKGHREGLTMDQYFLLSYGARKGTADVALKTAEAGYLTRRLVDVGHDCVVNEVDCGTKKNIVARNIFMNGVLQSVVYDKILKRVAAADIKNPVTGRTLIAKDTLIDEATVDLLKKHEVTEVPIRSPALCDLTQGVCARCYGGDLSATSSLVNLGEAVGVIAAQSIGEPGTQLTMGSFHSGGVAKFGFVETTAKTPFSGTVHFEHARIIEASPGEEINISRDFKIYIKNKFGLILADFDVPYGAKIPVKEGDFIEANSVFATWKPDKPIIAEFDGTCKFINLLRGINYEENTDDLTGEKKKIVIPHKQSPYLTISGKDGFEVTYFLPHNTLLHVNDNAKVKAGTTVASTLHVAQAVDIVGGLQRVISVFENRPPIKAAILAKTDGVIHIQNDKKGKNIVVITDAKGTEHEMPAGDASLTVQNGQLVKQGDMLTVGTPLMQDILDYRGIVELIEHFVKELQSIYLEHSLKINDKHLEVILHQVCRKIEIEDCGNPLLVGRILDRAEVAKKNLELSSKHKQQISGRTIIQGITHAASDSIHWLSSASFQHTTRIITWSGLVGAEDDLSSIKSSIIAGTLIKAGTGFAWDIFNKMADELKAQEIKENLS